jgi:hypothetical protein
MTPLAWKDTVTVYLHDKEQNTYNRAIVENCFWDEEYFTKEKSQGTLSGLGVMLFIPYTQDLEQLSTGVDENAPYISKGELQFEFDPNGEPLIKQIRDFESQNKGNFWRPKETHKLDYGSKPMWHFEVVL